MTTRGWRALGRAVVIPVALVVISAGVVMSGGRNIAAQDGGKKTATSKQDQQAQAKVDKLLRSLRGRSELVGSGVPPSRTFAMLDNNKELHSILNLTDDQVRRIIELDTKTRSSLRSSIQANIDQIAMGDRDMEATQKLLEASELERMRTVAEAEDNLLEGILTKEQAEMFKRVNWNSLGTDALADPELAARLQLTRSQRRRLKQLIAERPLLLTKVQNENYEALAKDSPVAAEAFADFEAYRDTLDRSIWGVLTPAQLARWAKIKGSIPKPDRQHAAH